MRSTFRHHRLFATVSCLTVLTACSATQPPTATVSQQPTVSAAHQLTKADIELMLEEGIAYLLRMIDDERMGVHKYYYALEDRFEERLHTIYTASTIFTLLNLYEREPSDDLWQVIEQTGEFVLSMQKTEGKHAGAFHYSIFTDTEQKENRFVVGTTSKTIFTLLRLREHTGQVRYLDAASDGADWLLTMLQPEGNVKSSVSLKEDGKWYGTKKDSTLYNGQVLSALSRMYRVTGEDKYLQGAEGLATYLTDKVLREGCYVGDDYRKPNPISSSWVILALLDYHFATDDEDTAAIVLRCSRELLGRQQLNPADPDMYGRWQRAYSTSGNGWIAEVLVEIYNFCRDRGEANCDSFKDAIAPSIWWSKQHTYGIAPVDPLPNPERARGGIYWNDDYRYVRTDTVCHGLNAYLGILDELDDGVLVDLKTTQK